MLSDPSQDPAFRESAHWRSPLLNFQLRIKQEDDLLGGGTAGPAYRSNSFSGNERNRLFLQDAQGGGFHDCSLVSGVDCLEDARSFALLDYDADGWVDIALMGPHAPRFRLFRNRMGEFGTGGRVVELDLEGANDSQTAAAGSNRDAVGATVTVVSSVGRRLYRKSIGEGFSAQNAGVLRIVLSPEEELEELQIRWPSGKIKSLTSGFQRRMKIRED